ncbi:excinuclease ABC subunit UvrC [Arthrobacter sp. zg-Y1171]|uniref:excinuclease ABC subunit UvrC n=1 Tax=unclassified Arthrobacter TaxID=235627 RepID=UPI002103AA0B|nr:excinuclease ABC subunit UvrC [Arthrobacter sp. zg-Y1171]MCQ1946956.1 excinuclease ABC subunit UvrC [Arthrobacter sp. zg-Y1116]MCQ1986892.1 excinuclease ABC subunit UvrC [Arthrobacter sp. zg-Y844]MCQ1995557.1 excinuclease ABC subunit UvrC [Arthrobacter sp. zg-Y1171]UWX80417.1 excinuclease ABC subunit UvrC [Arthrobacter sp. zg-Y1171]
MADPATYRPKTGEIPTAPGVYRFRDEHGRVIYVGKAKNLRSRLNSYFANPRGLMPKTRAMVHTAAGVEWTVVGTELEALQLEYTWIKEFNPRFNIMFRDDKSYPYLAVTMGEKYPRAQVMRGDRRKDTRYFGPFYPAKAIRETLDTLLRVFPVRTCSSGVFKRAERTGRPCLLGYIDKCSAPCVGRISPEDHRELASELCDFMAGEGKRFISSLEKEMQAAVAELDYETAARLRDDISALRKVFERNNVVLSEDTDADIFALEEDELEASAQVFHVRGGRIRGQRGWVVEKVEDNDTADLVEHLIQQVYGEANSTDRIPRQVLVPVLPPDAEELAEWLGGLRGARVDIRVPMRGDKKALMETVARNAADALRLHKSRRAGDITTRSAALQELQEALDLPSPPLRIECYDISHVQGTNVVASMVVAEDGLPKKSDYRKFSITGDAARDDTSSMYNVISRRFRNYLAENADPAADPDAPVDLPDERGGNGDVQPLTDTLTPAPKAKFAYPPNLVVVDGGQPQVAAASKALADLGITDVQVVGLAKRLEEVWVPDSDFPVILPRASEALFLLQRVRDEAHRFAITFHRQKRGKSMTASLLDEVPGLGPSKRQALLKHFGSVKKLRAATEEELLEVPGIGPAMAANLRSRLADKETAGVPAVNMATGEILET